MAENEDSAIPSEMESSLDEKMRERTGYSLSELKEKAAEAQAEWVAYRAYLKELAARISSTYSLLDCECLEDRLLVAFSEMRDVDEGKYLISLGDCGDLITDEDRHEMLGLKKDAACLLDNLNEKYNLASSSPEAAQLRLSLKAFVEQFDRIVYNRRIDIRGKRRYTIFFLVYRLGKKWPEIAGTKASSYRNKITGKQSKFYSVICDICASIGKASPSEKSVQRYLALAETENSPWNVEF